MAFSDVRDAEKASYTEGGFDIDKWAKWRRNIIEEVGRVDVALFDATFYQNGEIPTAICLKFRTHLWRKPSVYLKIRLINRRLNSSISTTPIPF